MENNVSENQINDSYELVIKEHDFEKRKNEIKAFAYGLTDSVNLPAFKTSGGLFNWFDYKVTGEDMNQFATDIQKLFIHSNDIDKTIVDQFKNVYETFELLDKDYIQKIIIAVKSAEKANERAGRAIDGLQMTVKNLSKFKSEVDSIEHLYDIDNMWDYCQKWQETISSLSGSIERMMSCSNENTQDIKNLKETISVAKEQTSDLLNLVNQQIEKLETVTAFTNELKKIAHLQDIDEMYDSLENTVNSLISVNEELDSMKDTVTEQQSDIESLLSFMNKMSEFEHLNDIDDIWNNSKEQQFILTELQSNVSTNIKSVEELQEYKNYLTQIEHLDDVDSIWEKTETYAIQLKEMQKQSDDTFDLVKSNEKSIKELHKIEHLHDVDEIWMLSNTHSGQLSELEKKNDDINNVIKQNKESVDATISDMIEKNDLFVQTLTKKIKYAYILAGSSFGIAIIELIMILLKVI